VNHADISLISHVLLAIVVIVFGLLHRHDLRQIVITFKNGGKSKTKESEDDDNGSGSS
jgi:hypothetical protein